MPTDFLNALKLIFSTCHVRPQRSKINKLFSSWSANLSKGSILRPILFNIYLKDIFYFLCCDTCIFVDDTTPCVCGNNLDFVLTKLKKHSIITFEWFENNHM